MDNYDAATFGQLNAADYDIVHDPGTTQESVQLIAELAPGGRLLELAIGTGRIALPLAQMGFEISGIDASPDMVAKLREKPGGDAIPVTIGDMADVAVAGPFDHVFLVFNTLFNLPSQEEQIRCFANTAKVLKPGGTFLIETFVPDVSDFTDHQRVRTRRLDLSSVWLEAVTHDPVAQKFAFQRIRITDEGMKLVPLPLRYAYPPEIDLMARLAGLQLKHRWGGWDKSAFTAESKMHVSVYKKPVD
ncbi:MAG: class I SAM-dependent methyltransferase [Pseudomonadota bacterium]